MSIHTIQNEALHVELTPCLPTANLLQLPAEKARQVRCFAPHGRPVESTKLLEGDNRLGFGQVTDHTDHAGVERTVQRPEGVQVLICRCFPSMVGAKSRGRRTR